LTATKVQQIRSFHPLLQCLPWAIWIAPKSKSSNSKVSLIRVSYFQITTAYFSLTPPSSRWIDPPRVAPLRSALSFRYSLFEMISDFKTRKGWDAQQGIYFYGALASKQRCPCISNIRCFCCHLSVQVRSDSEKERIQSTRWFRILRNF